MVTKRKKLSCSKNIPKFIVAEHCRFNRESDCWHQVRAVRYRPS